MDYYDEENSILCRAFLSGAPGAKYSLRGQDYEYDFRTMEQVNTQTGKKRSIRPPPHLKAPSKPLVPSGPTMMVRVPPGYLPGDHIKVPHPQNQAVLIAVSVPLNAQPGATLLVPVPPVSCSSAPLNTPPSDSKVQPSPDAAKAAVGVGAVAGVALGVRRKSII